MLTFTAVWPGCFGTLAILLLLSGLDDSIPLFICLRHWLLRREKLKARPLLEGTTDPRRIAIFVPCWKESAVIGNMVRHNLAAIRYTNYDFFLGAYPNDEATIAEAARLAEVFPNVHVAVCPNPGPTSKADCLNAVFRFMAGYEAGISARFDTIVLHDAEDMIHPEALNAINRERFEYSMVQIPVLPLPTPLRELTHGVYCDEFAEFQAIDMQARQYSRSFIPSNGVGTGFAREILEQLAQARGQVFDAASLTEDYEIGVYIHASNYRQIFTPLSPSDKGLIATREYFPRTARSAIRQRTRWVTGIALQCWERHGWSGDWRTKYWFWRDRKGLVASPMSLLTNLLFVAGLADLLLSSVQHRPWAFAVHSRPLLALSLITTSVQGARILTRMICVGRIFGARFSLGVPLRVLFGNLINCFASIRALWRYARARREGKAHTWLKTDHAYPNRDALVRQRGELSDVMLQSSIVTKQQLEQAQALFSGGGDLGDLLVMLGMVSEDNLCRARSLHAGFISGKLDAKQVKQGVIRGLPRDLAHRLGVLPVQVCEGRLLVAGARVPEAAQLAELSQFSELPVDFQLVTQSNFEQLTKLSAASSQSYFS